MSGYAARAPRQATVYACQVTMHPIGKDAYRYESGVLVDAVMRPVAHGVIRKQGNGLWLVKVTSLPPTEVRSVQVADESTAKRRISEWLSRLAGTVMQKFNPQQRYAIGQQECPYLAGQAVCGQPPEVGSVWCEWHPHGKARKE